MTDYNQISDTQIDPDAPITSGLGYQFRDNPIAIAEGSLDAPVLSSGWHPYDMVNVGDGNDGVIWDFAVDGAVASVVTPTFVDGYEYALQFVGIRISLSIAPTIDLYKATDAAYETCYTATSALTASVPYYGLVRIIYPRVPKFTHSIIWENAFARSTGAVDGAGSAFDMDDSTLQVIGGARFSLSSGQLEAGSIRLLRRREFISG